jgi:hypothetical protein
MINQEFDAIMYYRINADSQLQNYIAEPILILTNKTEILE